MNDIRNGHYTLGKAYLDAAQYAEAIPHFESALRLDPDFIDAYHGLALAYFGQHQLQAAQNAARDALKIDENYKPALSLLQALVMPDLNPDAPHSPRVENPISEAPLVPRENQPPSVVDTQPDVESEVVVEMDTDKELERGLVFLNNKQYPQAEAAFKKVIKDNPHDASVHYNLAQTYLETDALNNAQSEVDIVLRLSPHYQPAHQLQTTITFVRNRDKRQHRQKKIIRYLLPFIMLAIAGFIAFRMGVFNSLLPEKIPPKLSIDAILEDTHNKNGYIDAGEVVRLKLTLTNSGSTAKNLKVRILPKSIVGLRYQAPDRTLTIRKNEFETVRIPITADNQARTKKVPIKIEVFDQNQIPPLATTDFQLNIKSKQGDWHE